MKKLVILCFAFFIISGLYSQSIVNKNTMKKFSIGMDFFTDFWPNLPAGIETRTINQGVNVFGMYNYQFGASNFSFAIGAGMGTHNLYNNCLISERNDTTFFTPINDTIGYKRSKLVLTYVDLPFEFRLKTKSKFRLAAGFKVGFLLNKHTKYKGDDFHSDESKIILKSTNVQNLESLRYGPTFRIGYKWFNLVAYYQLSEIFKPGQGPKLYPISVGITLMPF